VKGRFRAIHFATPWFAHFGTRYPINHTIFEVMMFIQGGAERVNRAIPSLRRSSPLIHSSAQLQRRISVLLQ